MTGFLSQLDHVWNQVIGLLGQVVIPDWTSLVGLLPVFVFIGLIGPGLTLAVLAWLVFFGRHPRAKVSHEEGPQAAPLDANGRPEFPAGLPHCLRDGLVFASGATRCSECRDDLTVTCPMCGLGRAAAVRTCGNCGLVLRVESRARVLRPAGPPPGGAAAA